ncbi:MAG TPA: hypothetical protein VHI71_03285 [Actinomycetota bacterium]|nr:hypothetical protein [Actinomycetota bacterium]
MSIRAFAADERGIVVSWLVRVVLGLAILGVVLFDAGSIVVNFFSLDGTADEVAVAVAADLASGVDPVVNLRCNRRSRDVLCRKAYETAREKGVKIKSAYFDQQGVFHVELKRTADTLIVGRIGPIEDWATATASAQTDTN